MPSKYTRRNPLLIPLLIVLVIALAAVVLLIVNIAGSNATSADLTGQISQLQTELQTVTEERDSLQQELDTAQTAMSEAAAADQEAADALEAELATAKDDIAALTEQNAVLTADNATLTEQNAVLTADNATLTEQVNTQSGEIATLTEQNATLTADNATLTEQVNMQSAEITALTEQNQEMTTALDALTIELSQVTGMLEVTQDALHAALDEAARARITLLDMLGRKSTVMGKNGPVSVTAVVNDQGVIICLTIDASMEDAEIGQRVMDPRYAEQFEGKTLPLVLGENVDAVTGATITSGAVVEALNALTPDYSTPHDDINGPMGDR